MVLWMESGNGEKLRICLELFRKRNIRWAALRNRDSLPDLPAQGKDIDIIVHSADTVSFEKTIKNCGFFLAYASPDRKLWKAGQVRFDVYNGKKIGLPIFYPDKLLQSTEDAGLVTKLHVFDELVMYLLHLLFDKSGYEQFSQRLPALMRLYESAGGEGANSEILRRCREAYPPYIASFVEDELQNLGGLGTESGYAKARKNLWSRTITGNPANILRWAWWILSRPAEKAAREFGRRNVSIAFVGLDGSGKSSIAEGVAKKLRNKNSESEVKSQYMGWWGVAAPALPRRGHKGRAKAPEVVADKGLAVKLKKYLFCMMSFPFLWWKFLGVMWPFHRKKIVVFDRYHYFAFFIRQKWLSEWFVDLACALLPTPTLVLYVRCGVGEMAKRRRRDYAEEFGGMGEKEKEYLARRQDSYQVFVDKHAKMLVLENSGSLEEAINKAEETAEVFLAKQEAR